MMMIIKKIMKTVGMEKHDHKIINKKNVKMNYHYEQ